MSSHPSTYVIAVALYAAAREQDGDAGQIALDAAAGAQDAAGLGRLDPRPLNRTRSYACIALRRSFPHAGKKWLARAVGSRTSPDVWVSKLIRDVIQQTYRKWWDESAVDRVHAAVEWAIARESGPIDLPVETRPAEREVTCRTPIDLPKSDRPAAAARPAVSERQRAAARMLEEAVRNTAALTSNGARSR